MSDFSNHVWQDKISKPPQRQQMHRIKPVEEIFGLMAAFSIVEKQGQEAGQGVEFYPTAHCQQITVMTSTPVAP